MKRLMNSNAAHWRRGYPADIAKLMREKMPVDTACLR